MSDASHRAEVPTKDHMFSNKFYDGTKFVAQTFLPALGTLYFALAALWNLPNAESVVGSITAFDLFLGVLLNVSTTSYNNSDTKYDGTMDVSVNPDSGKKTFSLVLDSDPEELEKKEEVVFNVNPVVHDDPS